MGITVGLLIPLLGTMLGAAFVFFMKKDMSPRLQKSLLGFASGVMVAASVWSLLIPAIEMRAENGNWFELAFFQLDDMAPMRNKRLSVKKSGEYYQTFNEAMRALILNIKVITE